MFKRKKQETITDKVEERFQRIIDLIRDLDKKEFNRLQEGMTLAWQAYQKVGQAKPNAEKEMEDIDTTEKLLMEDQNE